MRTSKAIAFAALLNLVVVASPRAFAETESPELRDLRRLNEIGLLMMAAVDGSLPPSENCGMDQSRGFAMAGRLHAAMDSKIRAYIASKAASGSYVEDDWKTNCMATCECGLYTSILEKVGFESLPYEDRLVYRRTSTLAMEQSKTEVAGCVRKNASRVCGSQLLTNLLRSE